MRQLGFGHRVADATTLRHRRDQAQPRRQARLFVQDTPSGSARPAAYVDPSGHAEGNASEEVSAVRADTRRMDRSAVHEEMEQARASFHELLTNATRADLRRKSAGTRWNDKQLLFHMLLGHLIIRAAHPCRALQPTARAHR